MKARLGIAIGLIGAAGLTYALLGDDDERDSIAARTPDTEPAASERELGELATPIDVATSGSGDEAESFRELAVDAKAASEADATTSSADALVFRARVVVERLAGDAITDLDGEIEFTLWVGETGRGARSPVVDGLVELRLERLEDGYRNGARGATYPLDVADARIGVEQLAADEPISLALADARRRYAFGGEEALIRFVETDSLLLYVEDARDGTPLVGIDLFESYEPLVLLDTHPGSDLGRVLTTNASSPFRVPLSVDLRHGLARTCFVRAPGYAWASVMLDPKAGGERRVLLERGGDLVVTLLGAEERANVAIRLHRTDLANPYASIDLHGKSSIEVGGIEQGELRVSAEIGEFYDDPLVIAEQTVEIVAGITTRVDLVAEPLPEVRRAVAEGTLVVPRGWSDQEPSLEFELVGPPLDGYDEPIRIADSRLTLIESSNDDEVVYAWTLGPVQTGTYRAKLMRNLGGGLLELPPGGVDGVELRVAPPVEITVELFDPIAGRPADLTSLMWWGVYDSGTSASKSVQREPDAAVFSFRVPRGVVQLWAFAEEYDVRNERVEVREAGQHFVVEALPSASALVQLYDGETEVPWPGFMVSVERVFETENELPPVTTSGPRESALWFRLSEPGEHRLIVPEMNGFEPHEPIAFEATRGECTEIVVHLERSR